MVEVGNQVVVLVPAGEDLAVPRRPLPRPVGEAILVVVVFDEFKKAQRVGVIDNAVAIDDLKPGLVIGGDVEGLQQREVGIVGFRDVEHPGLGLTAGDVVLCEIGVGVLPILLVGGDFKVGVEAL